MMKPTYFLTKMVRACMWQRGGRALWAGSRWSLSQWMSCNSKTGVLTFPESQTKRAGVQMTLPPLVWGGCSPRSSCCWSWTVVTEVCSCSDVLPSAKFLRSSVHFYPPSMLRMWHWRRSPVQAIVRASTYLFCHRFVRLDPVPHF